ncbi:MAG: PA14 domain-containing protein [Chitinophagaceae bacterium]
MIHALSQRGKLVAIFLFGIFYSDFALAIAIHRRYQPNDFPASQNIGSGILNHDAIQGIPKSLNRSQLENVKEKSGPDFKSDLPKEDVGGPDQPEMSSFSSVNASNMVDLFSGDFSYNVPLMDVGGYPVNIHYSSGVSMDQEASWVGLGWNINPGTISRSLRGLPDDFNGNDSITKIQSIKENRTVGGKVSAGLELFGGPMNLNIDLGAFHNSYNGWGVETGINASINSGNTASGSLTGSLGISNNSQTGLDVSPSLSMKFGSENSKFNGTSTIGSNYNSRAGISGLQLSTTVRKTNGYSFKTSKERSGGVGLGGSHSSFISFATSTFVPTITMPMTSTQLIFSGKLGGELFGAFTNISVEGYVSRQKIEDQNKEQRVPAYGYLHLSKASPGKVLLDFNREKDIAFNEKVTPNIALPQYTYDAFSISGEGTGGMFRPYRGDVGYIYDHSVRTESKTDKASGDYGFGKIFHGGVDISNTSANTESSAWLDQNNILKNIRFSKSDSTFEEVYFRNPGEKSINSSSFYKNLGGDSLIRVRLAGKGNYIHSESAFETFSQATPAGIIPVTKPLYKDSRDKRGQVISYLNAFDASRYGLDKVIRSFKQGLNPVLACENAYDEIPRVQGVVRKAHHISQISVLNPDGRRYVYGLPVYNVDQRDVVFSISASTNQADNDRGVAGYDPSSDNSTGNNKGKDNYFNSERTPAYAHSFLLTGLLSADYVDVTEDGITEDDLGDGVKFNYTQAFGPSNDYYHWRTPGEINKANYNEGLKSYNRDDKGTYMIGKKEVWYLHSLESKTMIATFNVSERRDAMSNLSENGGLDENKRLKKLDSIQLFVKADLLKNGANARPVKTVHFEYNYELCKNIIGKPDSGKLTLKKIWFSYNGNRKGRLNPYNFTYKGVNPDYNPGAYDRWGNYKNPADNPGGTTKFNNRDFPYAIQDSVKSANYSAAWLLTDIRLPSGGALQVTYEGDDYAFVQDKRASQMFEILGFGYNKTDNPDNRLYNKLMGLEESPDRNFLFIKTTSPVNSTKEIQQKYLEGINKLYVKLSVNMPKDIWGGGEEMVPTYIEVEEYGIVPGKNDRFWVKMKQVRYEKKDQSPTALAALQFLRLNLPSKAYPVSEPGDNVDWKTIIKMVVSSSKEIRNVLNGFGEEARRSGKCQIVNPARSFVRLNNPEYKKYGGGIRVKSIRIYDNWKNMTTREGSAGLKESVYGQEYTYTTTVDIDGAKKTISSGVASYEPTIGNEENPFRTPVEYIEKVAPLAPTDFTYTETPLGESFFPSPSVGYSRVRVRTINAKAKSANGWEETEHFTTRDFPTISESTPFDGNSKKRHNPKLQNFLRIYAQHNLTLSQGFKIELNDMNGKVKSQSTFAETDPVNPIKYTENFYKVDNDSAFRKKLNNMVWAVDSANGHINQTAEIGKEVEVMVDVRQQKSTTFSGSFSPNLDIVPGLPVFPIPSMFSLPQYEQKLFRSVAVLKIVQRYGILDSIVVIDKGSKVSTKNMVYDAETGGVLLSRTNNEFNDFVYNFSYPAHWAYTGMGMAYKNIDAVYSGLRVRDGIIEYIDRTPFATTKHFESGDELIVSGRLRTTVVTTPGGNECPGDIYRIGRDTTRLWAISGLKGQLNDKDMYLIDSKGQPYSARDVSIRVIRSGKRNFTDASVGGITSLGNPVRDLGNNNLRIVIDTATMVINTTASSFKDMWQVEKTSYQEDSCYTVIRTANNREFLPVGPAFNFRRVYYRDGGDGDLVHLEGQYSPHYVASARKYHGNSDHSYANWVVKSIVKFDLSDIPAGSSITNATFAMPAAAPVGVWGGVQNEDLTEFPAKTRAHYNNGDRDGTANSATLKNVTQQWNAQTLWNDVVTGSYSYFIAETEDRSCIPQNINVTAMAQNFYANPATNWGIVFDLEEENSTREYNSSERTHSYCAPQVYKPTTVYRSTNNITPEAANVAVPGDCVDCDSPVKMLVTYNYQKDTCVKVCRTNIADSAVNPYRWGILGNWRPDRGYTFYHDRLESAVDTMEGKTNIRFEGQLKEFVPYWSMTDSGLVPVTDTVKWVWNSATSQYNRKGLEIENYDPLGRYNSGLYGYNETLPVAVAQNSRYKEILYDGFEDYGYQAQNCNTACATPRSFDFRKGNLYASIDASQSHTGRYSLRVNSSRSAVLTVPVDSGNIYIPKVHVVGIDSTPVFNTTVTARGKGLSANYYCTYEDVHIATRLEGPIDHNFDTMDILTPCEMYRNKYRVEWTGYIQPAFTDTYQFWIDSGEEGGIITVNGVQLLVDYDKEGYRISTGILLEAGKLYPIRVTHGEFDRYDDGRFKLGWVGNQFQVNEVIPQKHFYPPNMVLADSAGSVKQYIKDWCIKGNTVRPEKVISPLMTLTRGLQYVVGGWVRVGVDGCSSTGAPATPDATLRVTFNSGSTSFLLQKTGVPIEGWQRYEAIFRIPGDSAITNMLLTMTSPSLNTYFDDFRILPFNSNMKSFAYDPVSLRLMAELDENNYATFYEYDDDGTLIRVKKETERGIKTIKETRSALFKEE